MIPLHLHVRVVVQHVRARMVRRRERIQIVQRSLVQPRRRNYVRSRNCPELLAGRRVEDRTVIHGSIQVSLRLHHRSMHRCKRSATGRTVSPRRRRHRRHGRQTAPQQLAEVSRPHLRRRRGRYIRVLRNLLPQSLVVAKQKQLVLQDRSAQRPAKLIPVVVHNLLIGKVIRVRAANCRVAIKDKRRSMNRVRPRLDRRLRDRATRPPKLRRCQRVRNAELAHRLHRRKEADAVRQSFVVIDSVQQKDIRLRTKPVRRKRIPARIAVTQRLRVLVHAGRNPAVRALRDTRCKQCKLRKITAVQWQVGKFLPLDHNPRRRRRRLHQWSSIGHLDRLALGSYRQFKFQRLHLRNL